MSDFELSNVGDSPKIFLRNFSELTNRYDAQFYWENMNFDNCIKISKIAKVSGGKRLPKGFDYSKEQTMYRYLRVGNISWDGTVAYNNLKYLSKELYERLSHYEIKNNDLFLAIVGATIGKCSLIRIQNEDKIILTENCARIRVTNKEVLPDYLLLLLQTNFLQKQIQLNYIQTTLPKLGLDRVLSLHIPTPPSVERQHELLEIYQSAFVLKQQKEKQAEDLLNSIDEYLLGEFGITLPEVDNSLESRIFEVNLSDISGGRFDPNYKSKIDNLRNLNWNYPLSELKDLIIGSAQYGANETAKESKSKDDVRYIRITDIDEIGNLKSGSNKTAENILDHYILNYNDILFARSGSVGRCYIHKEVQEKAIFAGYLIRFILDSHKINPDYLFYYCHSSIYKYWVSAIERPALQSNINSEEYKSLQIPLPPMEKQNEIVNHIRTLRDQAKELQLAAIQVLEDSKLEVEKMILDK